MPEADKGLQAKGFQIQGRIAVPIMSGMAHGALPLSVTKREPVVVPATVAACPRRCEEPVCHDQRLPVPEALVSKLPSHLKEGRVLYVLRELVVPHHSGHVQILDDYDVRLAVADHPLRHLVYAVLPDVGYLLMKHRHLMFELLPVVGALLLFRQHPLEMLQPLLMLLQRPWIPIFHTVRADCQTPKVEVDAKHLRLPWHFRYRGFLAVFEEA